jgi:hypothetical protein
MPTTMTVAASSGTTASTAGKVRRVTDDRM